MHTLKTRDLSFLVAVALVASAGMVFAQTFTGPTTGVPGTPGSINTPAPINVGTSAQIKDGPFGVNNNFNVAGLVNIGTLVPFKPQSVLELSTTTAGLLPPRLTTAQRDAVIPSSFTTAQKATLDGLTIYNKSTKQLERFDGTSWGAASGGGGGAGAPGGGSQEDGPAFAVTKTTDQSVSAGSTVDVSWQTKEFDKPTSASCCFTLATGVFTPNVPGQYLLTATVRVAGSASGFFSFSSFSWNKFSGNPAFGNVNSNQEFPFELQLLKGATVISSSRVTSLLNREASISLSTIISTAATGDTFKIQLTNKGNDSRTISSGSFSGSRVGNSVTITPGAVIDAPPGAMIMWTQTLMPSGWQLCDGTNSTPDMRGRFAVGAGSVTGQNGSTFTFSPNTSGGSPRLDLLFYGGTTQSCISNCGGAFSFFKNRVDYTGTDGAGTASNNSISPTVVPPYQTINYICKI